MTALAVPVAEWLERVWQVFSFFEVGVWENFKLFITDIQVVTEPENSDFVITCPCLVRRFRSDVTADFDDFVFEIDQCFAVHDKCRWPRL